MAERSKVSVFRLRSWMRRLRVRISAKAIYEFINFSNFPIIVRLKPGPIEFSKPGPIELTRSRVPSIQISLRGDGKPREEGDGKPRRRRWKAKT